MDFNSRHFLLYNLLVFGNIRLFLPPLRNTSHILCIYLSNLSRYILANIGLIMPPCGVPLYVLWNFQFSKYPARRNFLIRRIKRPSSIFSLRMFIRTSWFILSKNPLMSPSINHLVPVYSRLIASRAVWQLLSGRNPWDVLEKPSS